MKYSSYIRLSRKIRQLIWNRLFSGGFKYYGNRVFIDSPDIITGEEFIEIGDHVSISTQCWLACIKAHNAPPSLKIGAYSQVGRFCHIVSTSSIVISEKVLIADKVYISDNIHGYEDHKPILEQDIVSKGQVFIGKGAWIGENVSIIGATIGEGAVVASNAVVTNDIPPFTIAAGVPARVIRKIRDE
ncbi:acyltransferase [Vibrio aestuarianus]|nr:acyltransferase [Vibrio aestuarianus]